MSIERRPGAEPPDQPEREQIPDYEIDLTGVVRQTDSLIDVIIDAIAEAGDDGEVPEWGARTMARYLANEQEEPTSALHHFAVTGRIDLKAMGNELAALWRRPRRSDFMAEIINRFGTYMIAIHRTEREQRATDYQPALSELIAELGEPLQAFLSLPEISPEGSVDEIRGLFLNCYAGVYDSADALVADVADVMDLPKHLSDAAVDHFASIDSAKVLKLASDTYTVVPLKGKYYCFWK